MNYFRLARRNLIRNARRSLVTILSITFGVTAIVLFAGYTKAMYLGLRNMAIHGEMIGQLSFNRPGWYNDGKLDPSRFLIGGKELSRISEIVRREFPGATVIPRMGIDGLLSNSVSSTIFIALGIDARDLKLLLGPLGGAYRGLSADMPTGVSIAEGLGRMLGLSIGKEGAVLVSTIDGQANASDVIVVDRVNTGNLSTNDKFMIMPINLARDLKNIDDSTEWITVLLDPVSPAKDLDEGILSLFTNHSRDDSSVEQARTKLEIDFKEEGLSLEVHTWRDLSTYYNQVKQMYDIIFSLLLGIVTVIVTLSITNAMSMSVVERTREIGTLRALGLRRSGVIKLFASEALLLVMIGSALGVASGAVAGWTITAADIRFIPPGNSITVPVYIGFDGWRAAIAITILSFLALAATYFPARKAAQQPIICSLSHA